MCIYIVYIYIYIRHFYNTNWYVSVFMCACVCGRRSGAASLKPRWGLIGSAWGLLESPGASWCLLFPHGASLGLWDPLCLF